MTQPDIFILSPAELRGVLRAALLRAAPRLEIAR